MFLIKILFSVFSLNNTQLNSICSLLVNTHISPPFILLLKDIVILIPGNKTQ